MNQSELKTILYIVYEAKVRYFTSLFTTHMVNLVSTIADEYLPVPLAVICASIMFILLV